MFFDNRTAGRGRFDDSRVRKLETEANTAICSYFFEKNMSKAANEGYIHRVVLKHLDFKASFTILEAPRTAHRSYDLQQSGYGENIFEYYSRVSTVA